MRCNRRVHIVSAVCGAMALLGAEVSAQNINTGPPTAAGNFGMLRSSRISIVQTVLVPTTTTTLQSFSFFVRNICTGCGFALLQCRAYNARFDPASARIVGPVLWQSEARNGVSSSASFVMTTFATPDVGVELRFVP
jgi:hypothetical protein